MFSNIDELPLGKLLQHKQRKGIVKSKSGKLSKLLSNMPTKNKDK